MISRFFVFLGRLGLYAIPLLIGLFVGWRILKVNLLEPEECGSVTRVFYEVEDGANLKSVGRDLENRNVLRHWYSLYYLNKLQQFIRGDKGPVVHTGEYDLSPGMTPLEIIATLRGGKVVSHPLTIPEGATVSEVAVLMAGTGLITQAEADQALFNKQLLDELQIGALTPEGFLFPETYHFSRPVAAPQIVTRIVQEGRKIVDEKLPGWRERAAELGLSLYELLILASIIERETSNPDERGKISSVFHNRLRIAMPLQSDPTVIYGLADFDGNLTKEHLKTPGPYNTYLNTGLPPTPIANPGLESIKAALYPEDTDLLYFVSKRDGSHHFSATYKEHVAAVNHYQRQLQQQVVPE